MKLKEIGSTNDCVSKTLFLSRGTLNALGTRFNQTFLTLISNIYKHEKISVECEIT